MPCYVLHHRHEPSFDIHVAKTQALSAFYHPFAYESGRGTRLGDAMRDSRNPQPKSFVARRSAD